jgi:hypothetical protein
LWNYGVLIWDMKWIEELCWHLWDYWLRTRFSFYGLYFWVIWIDDYDLLILQISRSRFWFGGYDRRHEILRALLVRHERKMGDHVGLLHKSLLLWIAGSRWWELTWEWKLLEGKRLDLHIGEVLVRNILVGKSL